MVKHRVGDLVFEFGNDWQVGKPDEWAFYRRHFAAMWDGIRAVDLLALSPGGTTLWLIEVKSFLKASRQNPEPLDVAMGKKAFSTLAMLLPAAVNAANQDEQGMAVAAQHAARIRLVFHIEQPTNGSKLTPRDFDLADIQQKMRQRLKPIDPHPIATDCDDAGRVVPWNVRRSPRAAG